MKKYILLYFQCLLAAIGVAFGILGVELFKARNERGLIRNDASAPTIDVRYSDALYGAGVVKSVVMDDDTCIVYVSLPRVGRIVARSREVLREGDDVILKRANIYVYGMFDSEYYVAEKKK